MPIIAAALLALSVSGSLPHAQGGSLRFTANAGQWNREAKFLARSPGLDLWVSDFGVTYDFYQTTNSRYLPTRHILATGKDDSHRTGQVIKVEFDGSSASARAIGQGRLAGVTNYIRRSFSARSVPSFGATQIKGLYPGIDMRLYTDPHAGGPRFDIDVAPGANLEDLKLRYRGAQNLRVNATGQVVYDTVLGTIVERGLYAYQLDADGSQHQVMARPIVKQGLIRYSIPDRDPSKPLVIDPLVSSTVLGSAGTDEMTDMAMTATGEQIVTGISDGVDYPITAGAYDDWGQNIEGVVTKFNADSSAIVWSTFIGGAGDDIVHSIVPDATGRLVIAGYTTSSDFPTVNAYDPVGKGGPAGTEYDAFLAKLSSDGSSLIFSTYFGSSGVDSCLGLAVDTGGRIYISGSAGAADLPTTGAYQGRFGGGTSDAYMASFSGDGQTLRFCTYLGGGDVDNGGDVTVDSTGRIIVVGTTMSSNFPTRYALQRSLSADNDLDGFISVLDATGKKMLFSTYYGGGGGTEELVSAVVDSTGRIIAEGDAASLNIAIDHTLGTPIGDDTLVLAITPTYQRDFATRISGVNPFFGLALASDDRIMVSGQDNDSDLPATAGAFQYVDESSPDAVLVRLNKQGSQVTYLTRFGGTASDSPYDGMYDANGIYHMVGFSSSPDVPTTTNAFDKTPGGQDDGILAQFDLAPGKVSIDPVTFTFGDNSTNLTLRIPTPVAGSTTINLTGGGGVLNLPNSATIISGQTSVTISVTLTYGAGDAGKLVRFNAKRSGQTAQRVVVVPTP